jgi:hypothetical protein
MNFEYLKSTWQWIDIPNCPGRFTLSRQKLSPSLLQLTGANCFVTEHRSKMAHDIIFVVKLVDGGLISYQKLDGTFIHTLNTPSGFSRKLDQLGISAPA